MYKKLFEYQEIDKSLKAMEDRLHGDENYKKYTASVRFLRTVNDTKAQIEERAEFLTDSLDELSQRYKKLVDQKEEFEDIDDVKEESTVAFLKKKADELANALKSVELEINSLIKEMNGLVNQYKTLAANTKAMKEQSEASKAAIGKIQSEQEQEKTEITTKLAVLEKDIDPELMRLYKDKRSKIKFPIVVLVPKTDLKHCLGCGTEFSSLEIANLNKNKYIECEHCKKMIFVKD